MTREEVKQLVVNAFATLGPGVKPIQKNYIDYSQIWPDGSAEPEYHPCGACAVGALGLVIQKEKDKSAGGVHPRLAGVTANRAVAERYGKSFVVGLVYGWDGVRLPPVYEKDTVACAAALGAADAYKQLTGQN